MPGRSAGEVFEMIRRDSSLAGLKICVITGRPELRKTIYDRSVKPPEGYLDKPVTEERLMLSVRMVLELAHNDR
jgi:CheY-like chemotaxis protein